MKIIIYFKLVVVGIVFELGVTKIFDRCDKCE